MQFGKTQQNMFNSNKNDDRFSLPITVLVLLTGSGKSVLGGPCSSLRSLHRWSAISHKLISWQFDKTKFTISAISNTYYLYENSCNNIISKIMSKIVCLNNMEFSRKMRHPTKIGFSKTFCFEILVFGKTVPKHLI